MAFTPLITTSLRMPLGRLRWAGKIGCSRTLRRGRRPVLTYTAWFKPLRPMAWTLMSIWSKFILGSKPSTQLNWGLFRVKNSAFQTFFSFSRKVYHILLWNCFILRTIFDALKYAVGLIPRAMPWAKVSSLLCINFSDWLFSDVDVNLNSLKLNNFGVCCFAAL